jgi:hypothetical protein
MTKDQALQAIGTADEKTLEQLISWKHTEYAVAENTIEALKEAARLSVDEYLYRYQPSYGLFS